MSKELGTFSVPVVTTLPGSGRQGQLVFLTTDLSVYKYDGSLWSVVGGGSSIPVVMSSDFVMSAQSQYLFRVPIVIGSHKIVGASGSVLVGV